MKKKLLLLSLIIVVLLLGIASCNATSGKYYSEKSDGTLNESSWIELSGKNWTDDEGETGTYEIDGTAIIFYQDGEELFDGTLEDGVLIIDFFGEKVYRKKTAPTKSENPDPTDSESPSPSPVNIPDSTDPSDNPEDDMNNGNIMNYNISLTKNISSAGTISGGGEFKNGSSVTIVTTTNPGYTWLGWFDDNLKVSTDDSLSYTFTINENKIFIAKWEANNYKVVLDVNGGESLINDTTDIFFGSDFELSIPRKAGYVFLGWYNEEGTAYTDNQGESIKNWDLHRRATLYARYAIAISTSVQLMNLSLSEEYILINDIDLGGALWTPIGTSEKPFQGIFDGGGNKIHNLKICDSDSYVGLFGYNSGTIKNLGVENFIIDLEYVTSINIGGLAGNNSGEIIGCYSKGNISIKISGANNYNPKIGLLVGENNLGSINNCFALGTINNDGTYGFCGGLVGWNENGTIANSFATGNIGDRGHAGGLIGYNYGGRIINSYATGDVKGSWVGALAYYNNGGTIVNCYAASDRHLVSRNSGEIINCFRFSEQDGSQDSTNYETMTSLENLKSGDWIKENLWTLDSDYWIFEEDKYPVLNENYEEISNKIFEIRTVNELLAIKNSTRKYKLLSDINLDGEEWTPIAFYGTFDGAGHKIHNFKITNSTRYIGFFEKNAGIIKNLGIENFEIQIESSEIIVAGGVMGENRGEILNCYAIGTINISTTSRSFVGGIMGRNTSGNVVNCYADVDIDVTSSDSQCGGLVGYNGGDLRNCYSNGVINIVASGSISVGGLVGNSSNTIQIINCFATGNIRAITTLANSSSNAGGLVGNSTAGQFNCYRFSGQTIYRKISSNEYTSASNSLGTDVSLANLMSENWIRNNLWGLDSDFWLFNEGTFPLMVKNYDEIANTIVEIDTVEELLKINNSSRKIKLLSDLNLNGMEWTPLTFYGTFDGCNNIISNVKLSVSAQNVGFFGYNEGIIKNIGIQNITINVAECGSAGGLTGKNLGEISNCFTSGVINLNSLTSSVAAGGLIGRNYGPITNCYSIVKVNISSNSFASAGGLVGTNGDIISNSYATGEVSVSSSNTYAGGLVGRNADTIINCYATGNINSNANSEDMRSAYAGGMVGNNGDNGIIIACYATGNVNVTSVGKEPFAGGFVGGNHNLIKNCYATGNISASSTNGFVKASGFLGANFIGSYTSGFDINCYRYSGQYFYRKTSTNIYYTASHNAGIETSLSNLKSCDYLTANVGFGKYISAQDLAANPNNVWLFTEGEYPKLYWEQ